MNVQLPFILDPDIKKNIERFVETSDNMFWRENTSGNTINRKFCTLDKYSLPLTQHIKEYNKYIFSQLNITKHKEENKFGNFIGVNGEGGNVHPHIDRKNIDGWNHVRVNFMVSKPFNGGMPVINGSVILIDENCSWFNHASLWIHSSTPVIGSRPRIILSLGAFVSPEELNEAKIY